MIPPGDTAYLGEADSPWFGNPDFQYFWLEDFEDGALDTPGISASDGAVRAPSVGTDSVDADDGAIDGFGFDGYDYFKQDPDGAIITFSFGGGELGHLPTHVGLVWTDGNDAATVTFTARDNAGINIGQVQAVLGDGVHGGSTAADRFIGVEYLTGIGAITISASVGSLEIDHIQYGYIATCIADLDGDLAVGFTDLISVLAAWGPCGVICCEDFDASGDVGFTDLLKVLSCWGPCPAP